MFYETMMDYLYDYLIEPLYSWLSEKFGFSTHFGIVDGQVYFVGGAQTSVDVGSNTYELVEIPYLITQLVGLVVLVLLLVLIVKFIVWLFKQISFITRF